MRIVRALRTIVTAAATNSFVCSFQTSGRHWSLVGRRVREIAAREYARADFCLRHSHPVQQFQKRWPILVRAAQPAVLLHAGFVLYTYNSLIASLVRWRGWLIIFWILLTEQLQEIRKTKLARVICDNTDLIDTIQLYPMVLPDHEMWAGKKIYPTSLK